MSHTAYLGLGANLGDAGAAIRSAMQALDQLPQTRLLQASSLYRSAPVGYADQPDFVNAVAVISTELSPHGLLDALLQLEHEHGRERSFRNAPRTLDLDILLFDGLVMHDVRLTLPHPRMHERAFVLQPLFEIAPQLILPNGVPVADLAATVDSSEVQRLI